jgi:hypothetical protein
MRCGFVTGAAPDVQGRPRAAHKPHSADARAYSPSEDLNALFQERRFAVEKALEQAPRASSVKRPPTTRPSIVLRCLALTTSPIERQELDGSEPHVEVVRSKVDLGGETRQALPTSATTGEGLDALRICWQRHVATLLVQDDMAIAVKLIDASRRTSR